MCFFYITGTELCLQVRYKHLIVVVVKCRECNDTKNVCCYVRWVWGAFGVRKSVYQSGTWVCLSVSGNWFGCEEVCFLPPQLHIPHTLICRTKAGTIQDIVVQRMSLGRGGGGCRATGWPNTANNHTTPRFFNNCGLDSVVASHWFRSSSHLLLL